MKPSALTQLSSYRSVVVSSPAGDRIVSTCIVPLKQIEYGIVYIKIRSPCNYPTFYLLKKDSTCKYCSYCLADAAVEEAAEPVAEPAREPAEEPTKPEEEPNPYNQKAYNSYMSYSLNWGLYRG